MLGGCLLGIALIGAVALARAGPAAWLALLTALLTYSANPDRPLLALAVGLGIWATAVICRAMRAR